MDGIKMNTQCSLPDFFLPHRFIFPTPNENILNILFLRKYLQAIFFIQYLCILLSSGLIFFFAMLFGKKKPINFIELSHSRYKTKTNKLSLFSVRIHCSDVSLRRKKRKKKKRKSVHIFLEAVPITFSCVRYRHRSPLYLYWHEYLSINVPQNTVDLDQYETKTVPVKDFLSLSLSICSSFLDLG